MLSYDYRPPTESVDGVKGHKPFEEWAQKVINLDKLNSSTMCDLNYTLNPKDHMRVSALETTKAILNKLILYVKVLMKFMVNIHYLIMNFST